MNEYNVNEHLKICLQKLKTCALCVLMDKGYTKEKAVKAVESIKKFNVYETKTGFRIETLVDDLKTPVFLHSDNTEVKFYSDEKEPETNDRLEKFETQLSNLQTLIDDTRKSQHDLKESINFINRKFKWIGENLIAE